MPSKEQTNLPNTALPSASSFTIRPHITLTNSHQSIRSLLDSNLNIHSILPPIYRPEAVIVARANDILPSDILGNIHICHFSLQINSPSHLLHLSHHTQPTLLLRSISQVSNVSWWYIHDLCYCGIGLVAMVFSLV